MRLHYAFLLACHPVAAWTMWSRWDPALAALALGVQFVVGCLGITLGYHRLLAHRSFVTPKWLERVFATCGLLALQGDPIEWVAVHRQHHRFADKDGDPHDARRGFFHSHMGWIDEDYFPHATEELLRTYAADLWKDPWYQVLHRFGIVLVVAYAALLLALGGVDALLWGLVVRLVVGDHCTWFVNSAGHCLGWRAYRRRDRSTNCFWVALISFGEGFHNNHHAFPSSARHGFEWWQIDVTWWVIRGLRRAGLAWGVNRPGPRERRMASRPRSIGELLGVVRPG